MNRSTGLLILAVILAGVACEPPEKVSPVPAITFKTFVIQDYVDSLGNFSKLGTLKFDFIDGDADLGSYVYDDLTEEELENLYNLFLIPYQKTPEGLYDTTDLDTLKYIIKHDEKLDRVGQNKTVKGEIKIDIQYAIIPSYDTLRYEFYIIDRALNKSNVAVTSDIGFR